MGSTSISNDILSTILAEIRELKSSQATLTARLDGISLNGNNANGGSSESFASASPRSTPGPGLSAPIPIKGGLGGASNGFSSSISPPTQSAFGMAAARKLSTPGGDDAKQLFLNWQNRSPTQTPGTTTPAGGASQQTIPTADRSIYPSRAVLTTYPGQVGITPIPLKWGAKTAEERGPVLASRQKSSLGLRNAIGAYGGAYSIYHALSVAIGALDPNQRPNYTNTEPVFDVKPNPSWFDPDKIVTLDPWGHLAQVVFKKEIESGIDIRPSISITRAHLKIAELDEAAKLGRLHVDGKIVKPSDAATMATELEKQAGDKLDPEAKDVVENMAKNAGIEVNTSKVAFEHVWHLEGMAKRLSVSETSLRRCLFEDTGGMYPELLTRPDLKLFFPPIGGGTCYIFGPPSYLSDPSKKLAVRVHDACSGSDIFGSDICTCRPYLLHGIEEAIKCAQNGGVGLIVYFQKEGRALGEVTKYLVYNARKRGGDSASQYFARTENIAGVKDSRFQGLMPDILHWLGVQKIDELYSMSDMKHDQITGSGIKVLERFDLPSNLIPLDGAVEIQAKIAHGYFSKTGTVTVDDLSKTVGRTWEDMEH